MKKFKNFISEVRKELKKVVWPTKKNMFKYSSAVIAVIIFFSLYFYIVDAISALIKVMVVG